MRSQKIPVGLYSVQMFIFYIFNFLGFFQYPSLFGNIRQIPLNQWASTWRAIFHQLNVEMLLAVKDAVIGITLKKPGILQSDAERSLFTARLGGEGSIAVYYYGSF